MNSLVTPTIVRYVSGLLRGVITNTDRKLSDWIECVIDADRGRVIEAWDQLFKDHLSVNIAGPPLMPLKHLLTGSLSL